MAALLKQGSKGAGVKAIQEQLIKLGAAIGADGDFGAATEQAVRDFQEKHGLLKDGVVGDNTRLALKRALEPIKPGKPEPDKSAMEVKAPPTEPGLKRGAPPPNADSLVIMDTKRPMHTIVVHCTATPEGKDYTVADIRAWHKARGWSDIGYHFVIARDGRVLVGRPLGQVGAHVENANTGTVGISYIGGVTSNSGQPKDTRTPAQEKSLLWICRTLAKKYPSIKKVKGHNDYTSAKACPSFKVGKDPLGSVLAA